MVAPSAAAGVNGGDAHPPSNVERLLIQLWHDRNKPGALIQATNDLLQHVTEPGTLDEVEFHLPQLSHLIIHLSTDLPEAAHLERFVLAVCQISTHLALQFFWIVYAALEEHNPKRLGDQGSQIVYRRCAGLLLHLEQAVVYGHGVSTPLSDDLDALVRRCVEVADKASKRDGEPAPVGSDVVFEGWLLKKGGGTSLGGRRAWQRRYFKVQQRVLYYFASNESTRAKGAILLSASRVAAPRHARYPNYFELHCRQSGLVLRLRADSKEDKRKWIQALQAMSALPQPPGIERDELKEAVQEAANVQNEATLASAASTQLLSDNISYSFAVHLNELDSDSPDSADDAHASQAQTPRPPPTKRDGSTGVSLGSSALTKERAVYNYFNSQRDFLRSLTNLAEELRAMNPDARQAALDPGLEKLALPTNAYFPLTHSSEKMRKVLRFPRNESVVFNTKARCPLLLIIETQEQSYSVAQALSMLGRDDDLESPRTVGGIPESPSGDAPPSSLLSLTEKKRESWEDKKERLRKCSRLSSVPEWHLASLIVKSNDDVRQEVFVMQMINYFHKIFPKDLCWLKPYHILATGPDTGLIQTITSAQDLDRIKKAPGYLSLRQLFIERYGKPETDGFKTAQKNFCTSLAAYSVVMWLMLLRDRHNGNLMLDDEGHFFHVDFGFVLGHSTGKQIGGLVECSPFKLTKEYVDLLDGVDSPVFKRFCDGCVGAMREARQHGEAICTLVEISGTRSNFPCFLQTHVSKVLPKLRKRLLLDKTEEQLEREVLRIVRTATEHPGTRFYDKAQQLQRGIAA